MVDDDFVLLEALVGLLSAEPFHVKSAVDPWDALVAAVEPGPLHLLLTDVAMPLLGGPELASRVRAMRREVPVLFMSAHPREDAVSVHGMPADARFLAKPFTRAALLDAVRGAIGS